MSETTNVLARPQTYATAIQQIDYPIHQGKPNPSHGKFFFVGSIPWLCYDEARNGGRGGSKIYDTEEQAIQAAIAGGAKVIQGVDCRLIDIAGAAA